MPTKEDPNSNPLSLDSITSPRPHLSSHHSSSVPNTPYSHDRKLSFGARSPSPKGATRNGSPQSTHSAVENGLRSKAQSFAGCKYETAMAFSRRRIPYSIGGDMLERAKAPPKKFLSREPEAKLTGDMRELFDRILPSAESDQRRAAFVQKLEKMLNDRWPGNEIGVHVFGSSGNLLCTSDSDVDICITTTMKALEKVCLLAKALADHGMERVICVPHAKVPIVKFWDPELRLACDMNVNNTLALENTRMIKTYVEIDERVRPLAMIIKHWTKRRILNDAALGGTLSSYTWICMILNFLQARNPPILPSLHKRPHARDPNADSKIASFNDDLSQLRGFGQNNTESIGELLFCFFRRYAHDLDYEKHVISVREGRLISKEAKKWHLMQNNRLCVEEPFNTERNLGNTADDISFRGIHLELRRAFDLISESKLTECLEQYEFPTTEEKIWEKPQPKPTPVLRSRSQSQSSRSGRGGYGNRGGRHGQYKSNSRRASSAAATNKYPIQLNDIHGLRGREYLSRDQQAQQAQEQAMALHQHFMLEMQHLHEQEQRLRMLQAQNQQAQFRESGERSSSQHYLSREPPHRTTVSNQVPFSAPLRQGQFYSPWVYPQVPGTPVQSVHTQPSSPSLKAAQPDLRRTLHRSSGQENGSNNTRSHSQPARPMPVAVAMQGAPPLPLNSQTFLQYQQQLRQQQQHLYGAVDMGQGRIVRQDGQIFTDPSRMPMELAFEDNVPKEYVGYWVNDSPQPYHYREEQMMPYLTTQQDLHPRMRGVPPSIDRLRRGSRSPSPSTSLPFRDRSYSVRSASSAPTGPPRYDATQHQVHGVRTGPVIVNGTDGWPSSEYPPPEFPSTVDSSSHTTISEATSGSEEQQYETPITGDMDTPFNGSHIDEGLSIDQTQQVYLGQKTPDLQRVSTLGRKGNMDIPRSRVSNQHHEIPPSQATVKRADKSQKSAGGLGIQFGEVEFPRPTTKSEQLTTQETPNQAIPTSKAEAKTVNPTSGQFEKVAVPVPLLSPVREVRTPSPTGKRAENGPINVPRSFRQIDAKKDLHIPSFAELLRAKQQKQQSGIPKERPNGVSTSSKLAESTEASSISPPSTASATTPPSHQMSPPSKPLPSLPSTNSQSRAQQPQMNGWQQQSSKRNKKNRSRPGSGQYPSGEPLPSNESERKGG